ncbi:uroporphyrinogen decarboxylase family protein [Chloroflexota bacterium]
MKPRDRLETALHHQEPDRVPIDLGSLVTGITSGANEALTSTLGIATDAPIIDRVQQLVRPTEALLERLHVDTRYVYINASRGWQDIELPDHTYEDEFSIQRKAAFNEENRLLYYDFTGKAPLAAAQTPADIARFKWPDPHDPARYAGLEERVKKAYEESDYGIIVNAIASIFEFSWYLRGYMQFYMDLAANPTMVEALLSSMREFQSAMFAEILDRVGPYVSVVLTGSDLGTQRAPSMSPETYKKLIWPHYKQLWDMIKSKTDAKIFYHSCGSIYPMIPHLIEGGVDILHPIQVKATGMDDRKRLKREFGKDITFWGGFDQQEMLAFRSVEEVREEAKRLLDDFMPGGGFVFISGHNIQYGVPAENVVALYDTVMEHGNY